MKALGFAGALLVASCASTSETPTPLVLVAEWSPIESSKYGLHERAPELLALAEAGPAEPESTWPPEAFSGFLPPDGVEPGDVWVLDRTVLLPFLQQFHAGVTFDLHHGSEGEGAYATLLSRGLSREGGLTDILLRVHADIRLEGGSWYTPSQFEGRLIWDTEDRRPLWFELAVPPRDTNVDVNIGIGSMRAADIGFVPVMRLSLRDPDGLPGSGDLEAARDALRRTFYEFARIDWLPFDRAVAASCATGRPLHVLILFGTLDDESC